MSALQNNVDALREQLAKQEASLESQKREEERIMREAREKEDTSWDHNIALLKSMFEPYQIRGEKEIARLGIPTPKEISHWRKPYEKDVALYHLFKRLDERLTHIERFLTYDIKKGALLKPKSTPWGGAFDF